MITKYPVQHSGNPLKCLPWNYNFNWNCYAHRPFERTITMHKDSTGHVGFVFKNGKITSIVKDSSAARNGLLTEHNICEVNGQNVIGLKVRAELTSYCLVLEVSVSFVLLGWCCYWPKWDILWGAGCALMLPLELWPLYGWDLWSPLN